jgi:hypothetical protein
MRTPEHIAKDQQAAEMRSRSLTYQQIGDALGMSRQAAHKAVLRAIEDIPKEAAAEALALELEKLDAYERRLFEVLEKKHLYISRGGKVVFHDGEPIEDDTSVIQAISALLRVGDRRAKLLGLNAPTRVDTELTINEGAGEVDRAIWQRALEFERWRTQQAVIDIDVSPALGGASETGADTSGG